MICSSYRVVIQNSYAWSEFYAPPYQSHTLTNFKEIPQIQNLPKQFQFDMELVPLEEDLHSI